jgi:hypothetical protein
VSPTADHLPRSRYHGSAAGRPARPAATTLHGQSSARNRPNRHLCGHHGWSTEVAFEDAKQITGVGEARNRTSAAVERTVPFALITESIVVLWYTHHGHTPQITEDRRAQAPWYRTKTQPAYLDMIVKLRRTLIAARFRAGTSRTPTPEETLAVHLAWAEAAA